MVAVILADAAVLPVAIVLLVVLFTRAGQRKENEK